MRKARILLVEDDRSLRTALRDNFEVEGFEVVTAADGRAAARAFRSGGFDLIVLDWMLPGRNGLDLLRDLRKDGDRTPVLMLTVRNEVPDRVLGLELGADDFLGKPFALQELLARVHALLRRRSGSSGIEEEAGAFRIGEVEIDLGAFRLRRGKEERRLSPKEARILAALHHRRGRVVSRAELLDRAWGSGIYVGPRTIDTHVLNLRKKLESLGADPALLETVHGVGYRLRP